LSGKFPRGFYFLTDQINRATLSISTNIAEGNGRFTLPDKRNFFGIARGSVQECVPLLELSRRREFIQQAEHEELKNNLEEISRMLSGLINGLDKREQFAPPYAGANCRRGWGRATSEPHQMRNRSR
jgi:four helix bundle protein